MTYSLNGFWLLTNITKIRDEREFPFPSILKNESHWFPFLNYGDRFFIPFSFMNHGNGFFPSLPVPELWGWIISFPSRSRIVGMFFFSFPFFLHCGNGFLSFPSRSRICPFTDTQESKYCKRYQTSNIFRFLYISYDNLYWGGKLSQGISGWLKRHLLICIANILDKAPRLSISIVFWILSSDTICQLN